VVICPGGGHYILAYDLEGTEVAEWLNSIGVTGIVLKYRVPAREREQRWRAAVQDAQRAVSVVRSRAEEWGVDPERIGILGFSAGGETAGLTALFEDERTYDAVDSSDQASCRPNFAILIYPGGFVDREDQLRDHIKVSSTTPPMFFVHALDDGVSPFHSVALFSELKNAGVPAELHVYSAGGHGYGLRRTELPVTQWPARCSDWMHQMGWLAQSQ
jgi:acetyl esterase/lipase